MIWEFLFINIEIAKKTKNSEIIINILHALKSNHRFLKKHIVSIMILLYDYYYISFK